MTRVFIALGSNINPEYNMREAVRRLVEPSARCRLLAVSPVYETVPVGKTDQPNFLNAAALIETDLTAAELKTQVLQVIEQELGRVRSEELNAPRTIDLDIALFGDQVLDVGSRHIPDPDISKYPHIAVPLADLAPQQRHPETGQTLLEIAQGLPARGLVRRPDVVPWPKTAPKSGKENDTGGTAMTMLHRLADLGQAIWLDYIRRSFITSGDWQALIDEGLRGVTSNPTLFEKAITSIAEKRDQLLAGWQHRSARLGTYQATVDKALAEMAKNRITHRIWAHDPTVWKPEPTEITNRLGWLHTAEVMLENVPRLEALAEEVRAAGYTHALLLGMGGSSLAPEVLGKTFGVKEGYLDLAVLDSTDPGAVLAHAERLDGSTELAEVLARTLFIVATKSGTTVETLSFFKFFYNQVADAVGADGSTELAEVRAGEHFVAITDPGTPLTNLADRYHFRTTFLNDPNIGGRYSALSYFGLIPAALVGVDVPRLLDRALAVTSGCESCVATGDNLGAWLGAILGELAKAGRDKVTFAISPAIASFGDWVEQLIAESTGKEGQGILPVVGEPLGSPDVYGDDRLFVHIRLDGDDTHDAALDTLEAAGHPVVGLNLHDRYDLGGQFFLWEMAGAVAGHLLGINPFDQPNVEAAKVLARRMVAEYTEKGALPSSESAPLTAEALVEFLAQAQPGDPSRGSRRSYIALQAYLQPTAETDAALAALRARLRDRFRLATTVGYGPRFLHSTGQLHKGDAGNGLFIQFTAANKRDAPIPDEAGSPDSSITFGVLKAAQALGDQQALLDAGRRVIRFHLGDDVVGGLRRLSEALS